MWKKADLHPDDWHQEMDRLVNQYRTLILSAERCRRDNLGKMTVKEAEYYDQAANVCQQIMDMNLSERNVCLKWQNRKQDCERMIEEIANVLVPGTAVSKQRDPTVSDSGFVSKNACEGVPAWVIERWYKPKPRICFDDIVGIEDLKERLLRDNDWNDWPEMDALFDINRTRGYIFYGPPGTGKSALVHAFAHEMMEQDENFRFIELDPSHIISGLVDVAEKTVQIAFQEALDNEPCLLFMDCLDLICMDRSQHGITHHQGRLTISFLQAYHNFLYSKKRVIFIGATNHPSWIDDWVIDHSDLCKCPLPDEAARAQYFAHVFGRLPLEEGLSFEDMADRTNNYSYRDMNRLSDYVRLKAKLELMEACQVFDGDGRLDQNATNLAAAEALTHGRIRMTRTMFEEALQESPVSDKAAHLSRLADFENRFLY